MVYAITTATKRVARLKKRLRIVQGGTSASKTISILILLIEAARFDKTSTLTSVVSESFPHLKRGAIRDFLDILEQQNLFDAARWNKTDYTYTFASGSKIEFFSADQPGKVRGPRRDRLFVNEANNIPFESFEQLEVRTRQYVFADYNPTVAFWVQEEIVGKRDDYELIVLTYKDNEALDASIVATIEQRRNRPNWWKVYGLGQLGEVEGRVYTGWQIIDEIPHEARLERYGLDFGYSPDPAAIVGVYYYDGGYILDEELYQKGLLNSDLAAQIKNLTPKLLIADNAEPKSIAELKTYGINVLPTTKGKDSVRHGVRIIQDQRISVTKRSVNLIKEYRNYLQAQDKEGHYIIGEYVGADHALDAARYAMTSIVPLIRRQEYIDSLPTPQFKKKAVNIAV